jgi:hypothetical protein
MMSEQLKLQLDVFDDDRPGASPETGETDAEMAARLQAEQLQAEEAFDMDDDTDMQGQQDDVLVRCYNCEGMCKVPVSTEQVICPFCQKTNSVPLRQPPQQAAADSVDSASSDAVEGGSAANIASSQGSSAERLQEEHNQEELLSSVLFSTEWDLQCKISDTLLYAAEQGTTSPQEEKMLVWAKAVRRLQQLVLDVGDCPTVEQMQELHDCEAELQREQVKAEMEIAQLMVEHNSQLRQQLNKTSSSAAANDDGDGTRDDSESKQGSDSEEVSEQDELAELVREITQLDEKIKIAQEKCMSHEQVPLPILQQIYTFLKSRVSHEKTLSQDELEEMNGYVTQRLNPSDMPLVQDLLHWLNLDSLKTSLHESVQSLLGHSSSDVAKEWHQCEGAGGGGVFYWNALTNNTRWDPPEAFWKGGGQTAWCTREQVGWGNMSLNVVMAAAKLKAKKKKRKKRKKDKEDSDSKAESKEGASTGVEAEEETKLETKAESKKEAKAESKHGVAAASETKAESAAAVVGPHTDGIQRAQAQVDEAEAQVQRAERAVAEGKEDEAVEQGKEAIRKIGEALLKEQQEQQEHQQAAVAKKVPVTAVPGGKEAASLATAEAVPVSESKGGPVFTSESKGAEGKYSEDDAQACRDEAAAAKEAAEAVASRLMSDEMTRIAEEFEAEQQKLELALELERARQELVMQQRKEKRRKHKEKTRKEARRAKKVAAQAAAAACTEGGAKDDAGGPEADSKSDAKVAGGAKRSGKEEAGVAFAAVAEPKLAPLKLNKPPAANPFLKPLPLPAKSGEAKANPMECCNESGDLSQMMSAADDMRNRFRYVAQPC